MAETWSDVLREDAYVLRQEAREYGGVGYRDGERRLLAAAEHAATLAGLLERVTLLEVIAVDSAYCHPTGAKALCDAAVIMREILAGPAREEVGRG